MDSVRSPAGPKKRANTPGGMPTRSRIPRSDVAPPAGFEPALPPPEAGKTLIMPVYGVFLLCLPCSARHELPWCLMVHCTNPCTTTIARHVHGVESGVRCLGPHARRGQPGPVRGDRQRLHPAGVAGENMTGSAVNRIPDPHRSAPSSPAETSQAPSRATANAPTPWVWPVRL